MLGGVLKFQAFPKIDGNVVQARLLLPQGTPLRRTEEVIGQIVGGLRSGMGYAGAGTLDDLRHRTRLTRITGAGLRESHPHDITILRDE